MHDSNDLLNFMPYVKYKMQMMQQRSEYGLTTNSIKFTQIDDFFVIIRRRNNITI